MRVEIGAMLHVHDAPPDVAARLQDRATFRNPEHRKRERLGLSTWGVPPDLLLWRAEGGALVLPRGLLGEVRRAAPNIILADSRLTLGAVDFRWRGALRPEQKQAAGAAFHAEGGVVVGPCGSGKTEMGLACIAAWRQSTLWIVHTNDLARQALERAQSLFGLPADAFGMIGDGRYQVGTRLTVATVQTLVRRDLGALSGYFGAIVLDEAHHAPASTFLHVLQAFPARFRLGLTATPDRADGLGGAMLAVFGPVAARLTTADLAAAGRVLLPTVWQVATAFRYTYQADYGALLAALCADPDRNALIAETAAAEVRAGHACLVLSERVGHCHLLASTMAAEAPDVPSAVM